MAKNMKTTMMGYNIGYIHIFGVGYGILSVPNVEPFCYHSLYNSRFRARSGEVALNCPVVLGTPKRYPYFWKPTPSLGFSVYASPFVRPCRAGDFASPSA